MLNRMDRSEKDRITQETFERIRAQEHAAVSAKTAKLRALRLAKEAADAEAAAAEPPAKPKKRTAKR